MSAHLGPEGGVPATMLVLLCAVGSGLGARAPRAPITLPPPRDKSSVDDVSRLEVRGELRLSTEAEGAVGAAVGVAERGALTHDDVTVTEPRGDAAGTEGAAVGVLERGALTHDDVTVTDPRGDTRLSAAAAATWGVAAAFERGALTHEDVTVTEPRGEMRDVLSEISSE